MTKITICKDREGFYKGFTCKGHAGKAAYGKDVVCASVSVLVINTINCLEKLCGEHFDTKSDENTGYIECKFETRLQECSVILMDAMVFGLEQIQKEYGTKFVQVDLREV